MDNLINAAKTIERIDSKYPECEPTYDVFPAEIKQYGKCICQPGRVDREKVPMYFQPQDVSTITQLNGHRILLHSSMFPGNLNLPSVHNASHMTLLQKYSLWMRYSLHSNLIFVDEAIHLNNVSKVKYMK